MIEVRRLSKPAILVRQAAEWTRELCAERAEYYQAVRDHPVYPPARKSRYAHQEVRDRLKEMFGNKCAYCESRVTAVSYQHVEHFRPQSIYPRLVYEWSNLLLACERCNSGHKRQQFPLMDGIQPEEDRDDPCSRSDHDEPVLIDPCREDPSSFFSFRDSTLVCRSERAERTREICGLDREDLEEERRMWLTVAVDTAIKALQLAAKLGRDSEKEEFRQRLEELLQPSMPYVAMTRARLDAMGIDPGVR